MFSPFSLDLPQISKYVHLNPHAHGQTRINRIFRWYLILLKLSIPLDKANDTLDLDHIKKVDEQLKLGCCHGYALCFAAFQFIGQQDWWESVLRAIITWDGNPKFLNAPQKLAGTTREPTLQQLLELALSYIIYYQTPSAAFAGVNTQVDMLRDSGYFKLIDHEDKTYSIKNSYPVTFKRTLGELYTDFFNPRVINAFTRPGLHILVANDHAIQLTIDSKAGTWLLYDPNWGIGTQKYTGDIEGTFKFVKDIFLAFTTDLTKELLFFYNYSELEVRDPTPSSDLTLSEIKSDSLTLLTILQRNFALLNERQHILHRAIYCAHLEIVKYLLKISEAPLHLPDRNGRTALTIAQKISHTVRNLPKSYLHDNLQAILDLLSTAAKPTAKSLAGTKRVRISLTDSFEEDKLDTDGTDTKDRRVKSRHDAPVLAFKIIRERRGSILDESNSLD